MYKKENSERESGRQNQWWKKNEQKKVSSIKTMIDFDVAAAYQWSIYEINSDCAFQRNQSRQKKTTTTTCHFMAKCFRYVINFGLSSLNKYYAIDSFSFSKFYVSLSLFLAVLCNFYSRTACVRLLLSIRHAINCTYTHMCMYTNSMKDSAYTVTFLRY